MKVFWNFFFLTSETPKLLLKWNPTDFLYKFPVVISIARLVWISVHNDDISTLEIVSLILIEK